MVALPENAIAAATREDWRAWLRREHTRTAGVWLVTWKKASGKQGLDYDNAVEEALAWGWIDSKPRKLDAERSMLWFAPRKAKTGWSAANKARIDRLLTAGLLQPAGLAKIEAAKRDGSWSKLDEVEQLTVPDDLAAALAGLQGADANFAAFPRSVKRGILEWIANAKRPATRAQRIQETATLAARNLRANQWPR